VIGMQTEENLPKLITQIYDAALAPDLWTDVLSRIGEFVGGEGGGIVSKDAVTKASTPHYHFGVDPDYVRIYSQTHSKFDSLSTLPLFDLEQVVSVPELVPYHEFRQGRFFHEWMSPQDWVDTASAVLEKSASSCLFLAVLRTRERGLVDDEMRQRMVLVVPHVRRAMLIDRMIDQKTAQASALADTLDNISAGVFLVDGDGRIVHANASGEALLHERSVLRAGDGRLAAIATDANQELNRSLTSAGGGDTAFGAKGVAMPLAARDGERYVAHVLPLTTGERRQAGAGYAATAALFVHKATLEVPSPPETIARVYNLTPTELRVLLAVVEIGGVPEIAQALDIGESTVKTHLHRLFAKTETTRQAELVKLVAGFSNPLVN
jgi:DNA-binding CsgD family transcriptional regulator/PAS domain-containing protein